MKKITLFSLSCLAYAGSIFAQGAPTVQALAFTANPSNFDGKSIKIENVILNLDGIDINAAAASSSPAPTGPAVGAGVTGAVTPGASAPTQVVRCSAPKGFKVIDIDFAANPGFEKCFLINETMFKTLPVGKDITADITFKGSSNARYIITNYTLR